MSTPKEIPYICTVGQEGVVTSQYILLNIFFISLYKRKPFPFQISSNILGHFLSVSEFRQIICFFCFFRLLESSVAFVYLFHYFFDISNMSKDAFSLHTKVIYYVSPQLSTVFLLHTEAGVLVLKLSQLTPDIL